MSKKTRIGAGRPPKYETAEEMRPVVERFIEDVRSGETVATITGLCLALGFESKDTLYNYRDRPEFSYLIKRGLLVVENKYEEAMREPNATGSIFVLKNMGWKDRTEHDHTTKGEAITPPIIWRDTDEKNK
jgi:hypothetical protein